ncbi:hypothetical protein BELL_0281g00100 [Botrytis elliptica]|uniref:Uncharacterized protein n=1 Tax=Botrytis elliptica TaxID=278938 RepID=A0A4Z1JLG7_9HELO|nr:hypothetical protein EAE99_004836 [Botrytis elliptica]TGO74458.1 hypothetical protein BELL_0281g00100 [Botrytis elliptica]
MSNDSYCINDNNGISSTLGNQSACYWPSVWTDPNSTEFGNVSISAIKACCGTSDLIDYLLNDQYNCVIQYCHFPPPNGDDKIMRCLNDVFLSGNSSIQIDLFCTGMDKIESMGPIVRRGTINTILLMTPMIGFGSWAL